MSNAALLKVYDGQEPDLCFGAAPGPGGVNSVGVGAGLLQTGSSANPVVSLGMTAVGDLLVGTGVATGAVLNKGANGNFLRVKNDGTGLEYAAVAPGGVDSVSAALNNVGLVLTAPLPASPTDPKIGLAFSAKADVPVGTAANTGVMVSAPQPLTTGLVLQTDTSAPSGVKWAPAAGPTGVITTNAPLNDDYTAPNNTLSIAYSAAKGEIPCGSGVANVGVLLPSSGNKGDVLSVLPTAPSGLAWVPPSGGGGGGPKIVRGTGSATTNVDPPTSVSDTLIIVAEEDSAIPAWVPVAAPLANPPLSSTYNIEFEMPDFVLPNGGGTIKLFGINTIVNSQKCVELYYGVNGGAAIPLGHFYNSIDSVPGKYSDGASVGQCVICPPGASTGNFENSYVMCGTFNFFHFENPPAPEGDLETHGIAQLVFVLENAVPVPLINKIYCSIPGTIYWGLGLTQTAPQIAQNTQVNRILVSIPDNSLLFCGCFNAIQTSSGDMATGGGTPIAGYASIIEYSITTGQFISANLTLAVGQGVYFSNYPAQPAAVGNVSDVVFTGGATPKVLFVGEWEKFAIDANSQYTPGAGGVLGFGVYDPTSTPNRWITTPAVPAPSPTEVFVSAYCIRPSVSIADSYIFTGYQNDTTTGVDAPRVYVYNSTTNVVAQTTGASTTLTINDFIQFYNGITSLTIDIGAGSAPHDFILLYSFTGQVLTTINVLYMTGGTLATTLLNPTPSGLVPQEYPATGDGDWYVPPVCASFSIQSTFGDPPATAKLVIGAENSKEQWSVSSGGNIVFNGSFYYDNAPYTIATFAPSTGTNLDSSQMLVATKDQLGWINVGAKATSLTYT